MPHHFLPRLALLLMGIILLSFAISFSIRSDIGTSPVASLPYIYSLITPLSVGMLTIVMQILMLIGQMLILGKAFQWFQWFQLPASIVLGVMVDLALWFTQMLQFDLYISKLFLCFMSCIFTAVGVCLMLKSNLIVMAIDALYLAICQRWGFNFGRCKMWGDITLVLFALSSIWIATGAVVGIREGTVICAILVGTLIRYILPYFDWIKFEAPRAQEQQEKHNVDLRT